MILPKNLPELSRKLPRTQMQAKTMGLPGVLGSLSDARQEGPSQNRASIGGGSATGGTILPPGIAKEAKNGRL